MTKDYKEVMETFDALLDISREMDDETFIAYISLMKDVRSLTDEEYEEVKKLFPMIYSSTYDLYGIGNKKKKGKN